MKNLLTTLLINLIALTTFAQDPQKFSYQSVIRNAGNQLVVNQSVGIKISILQGSATGSAVYVETHSPLTNANGLATIEIGGGTVLSGNFANINWANGPYFVKTETDVDGGSNYTIITTQQLLSVPYAMYANNTSSTVSASGDTLFIGNQAYIVPGISAANTSGGGQTGITAHTCGADSVHNPAKTYGTMTDQQGNVYKTIIIGTQEWMAENLRTSIYRNGDSIETNLSDAEWENTINTQLGAWAYFNNDTLFECPYGKLYNYYAAVDPRNVCPIGWHLPTDVEWNILVRYIDPELDANINGAQSEIAGGYIRSSGGQYWVGSTQETNNGTGFSAIPGSFRAYNGTFNFEQYSHWWSSNAEIPNGDNVISISYAWMRSVGTNTLFRSNGFAQNGLSVRCLKDGTEIPPTSCGASNVHNSDLTYGSMTDQEGNIYKTIFIGNQEWMAENLTTTTYSNGDTIDNITDSLEWSELSFGAWCYYNNNIEYECPYGKLYNWYAIADSRKICPIGWHAPTIDEWGEMLTHLGNYTFHGGKIKSESSEFWQSPNYYATNESGFSGLPGGTRESIDGNFIELGSLGYWWQSTEANGFEAYCQSTSYNNGYAPSLSISKKNGFSVRCLRD